jgi:polysaccharide deacetylase family protein (PEP-CTERM system associated)
MLNAMTVDLEDWPQAVLDPRLPVSDHVVRNAERVLELLGRHGVRATFFALGKVCERHPRLLPAIASAGHEIASHGYCHELVYRQSPAEFAVDVQRSIDIIEAQTGQRPVGYRAPAFSITRRSLWAGPILAEAGFRYSSSVFPVRKRRYGIPDWPALPGRWPHCDLVEFPLTTLSVLGHRLPTCGGGYMRLWPLAVHAQAISRRNLDGSPAVIYLHPYELAPEEIQAFRQAGIRVRWQRQLMQSLWRSRVEPRVNALLDRFAFGTMRQALLTGSTAEFDPLRRPPGTLLAMG